MSVGVSYRLRVHMSIAISRLALNRENEERFKHSKGKASPECNLACQRGTR